MEDQSLGSKLRNESVAETVDSVNSVDADTVPAKCSERKLSIIEALYSPEAADIELEICQLGPELRPVDFGVVLEPSDGVRPGEKTTTPTKKSLTNEIPTDAAISEAVPGRSAKRNIVEVLYSPETADFEWEPEPAECPPFMRPVDL